jgi:hypothetical protein
VDHWVDEGFRLFTIPESSDGYTCSVCLATACGTYDRLLPGLSDLSSSFFVLGASHFVLCSSFFFVLLTAVTGDCLHECQVCPALVCKNCGTFAT